MNRLARLLSPLVLLCVLAACAKPAVPTAPAAATSAPKPAEAAQAPELFLARPEGARGPLVAYDMASGLQRFTLPAGLMAADEKSFFTAAVTGDKTTLWAFDVQTGRQTGVFPFDGQWALSGVSPNGRWAAFTRLASESAKTTWTKANTWKTDVLIVDAQDRRIAHTIRLDGNFEVDGLSRLGNSLFLIHHLPPVNPDRYQVRLYDLAAGRLQEGALVDKRAPDEVMAGQQWEAVGSRDGRWLLTLYLRTKHHSAFIHALDLDDRFTFCIDLPSGDGNMEKLKAYTLALAPDDRTIYAANPALGLMAKVSLDDLSVTNALKFDPIAFTYDPQEPRRSLVSNDGQRVYFAAGPQVWAYDLKRGAITSYEVSAPVTSVGVSGDAQRLYLTTANQALQVFDAINGQALSFQTANVQSR